MVKLNYMPNIGKWYKCPSLSECFRVTALDEDDSTIEIQYLYGDVEEIDSYLWQSMRIEEISAPEDWSAAYGLSQEDLHDRQ